MTTQELKTATLRLTNSSSSICSAPKHVAEHLFHAEGFTDIHYVEEGRLSDNLRLLASGKTDLNLTFVGPFIACIDAGDSTVILAGAHIGCFELFGTEPVRTIRDQKGKTVAVPEQGGVHHLFLASMAQYVGLDPCKDLHWLILPSAESIQLLAEGKIDALVGFPPVPQEIRPKKIGHVVVNSAVDRPWSQYFCCIVTGNREFVRKHPVATKRALRAILKATGVCALKPGRAAQRIVNKGFPPLYDNALQSMQEVPYNRWREYDPERYRALLCPAPARDRHD